MAPPPGFKHSDEIRAKMRESRAQWIPRQDAILTRLWGEGVSGTQIGARLGITKNAVIGRVHRLKLPPRPSPIPAGPQKPKAPRAKKVYAGAATLAPLGPVFDAEAVAPEFFAPPVVIAHARREERPEIVLAPRPPRRADGTGCEWVDGHDRRTWLRCDADLDPRSRTWCSEHFCRVYVRRAA